MTGYGAAERFDATREVRVELKSWNNKFAEVVVQLPNQLLALEDRCREVLREVVLRGRVDAFVRYRLLGDAAQTSLDSVALTGAIATVREIKRLCGDPEPVRASEVLAIEGVIGSRSLNADEAWAAIEPTLRQAATALQDRRVVEGEAVRRDLQAQLARVIQARALVAAKIPAIESNLKTTLRRRFAEVLGDQVDEQRVLQELAVVLSRYSIHEELERLSLHCEAFQGALNAKGPVGKRIDFLAQEMNREVNTIGSKSADFEVDTAVVEMKEAIDTIREQARNVE